MVVWYTIGFLLLKTSQRGHLRFLDRMYIPVMIEADREEKDPLNTMSMDDLSACSYAV